MRDKRGGRLWLIILMILLIISGLGMNLYPMITGRQQQELVNEIVENWKVPQSAVPSTSSATDTADTATAPTEVEILPELLTAMESYNQRIFEDKQAGLVDAWSYQADVFDLSEYGIESEAVGIISIPSINVELPLYLGATYDHMAMGFAQLSQTSMPIGGENSNCVIAGHRGWRGAGYMRDADKLNTGDAVYLQNFWETLEYRVYEIKVIEPNEIQNILIQPGKDLLTIVTCTPYGVGSHRLLIYCERYINS